MTAEGPAGDAEIEVRRLDHPSELFAELDLLRYEVLHHPFGVSRDDEWHDEDPCSTHLVALAGGRAVGYARLLAAGGAGQIRQVAVSPSWERRGIGTAVVRAALRCAAERGLTRVWLNARVTAVPFYEKLGFAVVSEVFRTPRTYVPHVRMEHRAEAE